MKIDKSNNIYRIFSFVLMMNAAIMTYIYLGQSPVHFHLCRLTLEQSH